MQHDELIKYRNKLWDLRNRLADEFEHNLESSREDVTTPGDVSSLPTHLADEDAEGIDVNLASGQNEQQMIEQIDEALERIEQNTYGTCRRCGREIPSERLDVLPFTPYCVECERIVETE